jgi:hypothetical protein
MARPHACGPLAAGRRARRELAADRRLERDTPVGCYLYTLQDDGHMREYMHAEYWTGAVAVVDLSAILHLRKLRRRRDISKIHA